ncbi:homeodomain-interacting protein kinase 2-like [Xyrichtys novacula]|uniref:Homeodomain-interacting protein kinase 2-like n=1 Tax=Xyrichtys novacula TaxID=13765 RepID=A0AAV1F1I7_XYRNO|nr:homeodomain-interacting protein kinase 2-like [Xyrichtys novacula]
MQLPYDEAVDMWTLGVTAAEMATGYMLYPGDTEYDVLSYITQLQGQPEDHVVDKSLNPGYFFTPEDAAPRRWRLKSPEEFEQQSGYLPQLKYHSLDSLDDLEELMDLQRGHEEDHHLFMDLVKKMLDTDPEQRIKPHEVLQHPFMTEMVPQRSFRDKVMMESEAAISMDTLSSEYHQPEERQSQEEEIVVMMESEVAIPMDTLSSEYHQPEERQSQEEEIVVMMESEPPGTAAVPAATVCVCARLVHLPLCVCV